MHKLNFKYKIFIYFAIAAVVPCLLFWGFIYQKMDEKLTTDYKEMSYNYVLNQIEEVDHFFQRQGSVLNSIAQTYTYIDKSPEALKAYVKKQAAINDDFLNLYIIRPSGELISSNGDIKTDQNYASLSSYIEASRRSRLVWLEPYKDKISGLKTIGIAESLINPDGELEGVIVANLNYSFFERTIKEIERVSDSDIFLIDSAGNIKFNANDKFSKYQNIRETGFILKDISSQILDSKQGNRDVEYNGTKWLCTFADIDISDWKVVAVSDANAVLDNVDVINRDIYNSITIFGFAILILITILSLVMSNSISGPLLMLRDGVKELALGNLEHTITVESNDEIKEVADTFNQMSYNLKKSYEDLFKRTEELYDKNENLQEMNTELEASYEQLGATLEQLNESEEKYRKLVNNISDMVVVLNNDAEMVYVNNTVENILKMPEAQLIGKCVRDILGDDLNENTLRECYANDYNEFQLRLTSFGKDVLYFECSTRRLEENGNVVGIQGILRDITQRKLMEEQLKTKYNELKAINNVSTAITGVLDLNEQLDIVTQQLMENTNALCGIIALFENEEPESGLVVKAATGINLKDKNEICIEPTKQNTAKALSNRKPFVMEYRNEESLTCDYFKWLYREEGVRYVLLTPLIAHDKYIGVMSIHLKDRPNKEYVDLIASIGNNVALSIDNVRAYDQIKTSYLKTVQSLISAVEAKDIYTESHSIRVAKYASFIASEMGLEKNVIEDIWVAGVLHDIGKIGISDSILNKKDRLTPEEYDLVKQHPGIAYKILSNIGLDKNIMYAVRHHHERHDGKGYPDGLAGEDISLMASIISIADAFDAITSERSYRVPRTIEEGMAELGNCKGTQFNPDIIDVFYKAFEVKPEVFYNIHKDEEIKFF